MTAKLRPNHANKARRRRRSRRRSGFAVILVLALISITLALSYAMMRSQTTATQMQSNCDLNTLARQAALTGLSSGLRQMSQPTWGGVSVTLTGNISSTSNYTVTYQTGDPSLTAASANYADWPYRVTVTATGYATDPAHPGVSATDRFQAVVRLIPRALKAEPPDWTAMQQYTVYQYLVDTFSVQLPCQVTGPVRLQGTMILCPEYPTTGNPLTQYLNDLNSMRSNGYADQRPVTGPVWFPSLFTPYTTQILMGQMGLSTHNISVDSADNWTHPGTITSYQIYPGGATYQIPSLSTSLSNTTLAPDPKTNPLGIYCCHSDLTLHDNVSIKGTVVTTGNLAIAGNNVQLQPFALPALQGTTPSIYLPTAVVGNNLTVADGSHATMQGFTATWNHFQINQGAQTTSFSHQGRLVTGQFTIQGRTQWQQGNSFWNSQYSSFSNQKGKKSSKIPYFPVYENTKQNLNPAPLLTITPDAAPVSYHWKNAADPVYVAAQADSGLRWDLLQFTDLP
jgi:hypothetical protein